ncbi:indole-3-glycerol phosphate synthase TrpC [Bacillus sp. HMF5848]|uniref:indole-3-glycerol phosphate synthase TrpC n=1 Tax=Bacillus sp. HMF5848 TaxID=2495421 RepID=UPI000F77777E|nr:indole-3-glycerol phosphate synthase TrpC [Bacillus sp. HMF5848]RSK27426.1 indole-3-glycerol phosphate synthase TrpC [Bacillus sp. HMF5848]
MLTKIVSQKKVEIEAITLPEKLCVKHYSLYDALKHANRFIGLIAEIKKASPSKGVIREDFDPVMIAKEYEQAAADAISVLTDQMFFQGSCEYLTAVKQQVALPILRKDFILEPIQVEQSVRVGADAILLIGEILSPTKLHELYLQAYETGLECLVEVHDQATLESLLKIFTPKIIGINNRDLRTFKTSIEQTKRFSSLIPNESLLVSESGIATYEDVVDVSKYGAKAILVGETFMRASSPGNGIHTLFNKQEKHHAT